MSAAELSHWAVTVMKFSPPPGRHSNARIPTPEEFNAIIRGPLVDVWRYVVTHVQTAQTVNKVKGNLVIRCKGDAGSADGGYQVKYQSDKTYNEERANLEEKRRSLSTELANQMTSIYHVERDLNRIRNEICSSENTYQTTINNQRDVNRKRVLLNAHSQRCGDDVARVQEFTTRVSDWSERISGLNRLDGGQSIVHMKRMNEQAGESSSSSVVSSLETVCAKEVRESCELIGRFLDGVLSGSTNRDKTTIEKCRADLWHSVEVVLRSYSPAQALASVCTYAQDSSTALHEHTARVNVRTDAENLRFKYTASGQLSDMSAPPSDLRTVRQHLEDYEATAMERFLQTEKCKTNALKYKQRLEHATDIVNGLLKKQAGDSSGAHPLIRSLLEAEREITVARSLVKLFDSIASELCQQIDSACLQKQILFMKYSKIQDFRKIVESKQNLIGVLVKQNRNSKHKLEIQQLEIQQYMERSFEGQDTRSRQMTELVRNGVSNEVEAFSRLVLPYFLFSTLDSGEKLPTVDLSIYRLVNNPTMAGNESVQNILKTLQFPSYKGDECLLSDLVQQYTKLADTALLMSNHSPDDTATSLSDPSTEIDRCLRRLVQDVLDICERVKTSDSTQLERLLPLLDKHQSEATKSLTACLRMKDLASDWWDQPAQMCNGWITVDGLNMQQWKDKWIVAVTRIRQGAQLLEARQ